MLPLPELAMLDVDLVKQQQTEASTRLQEMFPTLDLRRGVFYDTLLYFHAQLAEAQQLMLRQYLAGRSLQAIEADPTLADGTTVEEVLSCWGVTRQLGTYASGTLAIKLNQLSAVTIAAGATFEADGFRFYTTTSYAAKTSEALVVTSTDRLITPTADGYYSFTIPVTARTIGSASNLPKDTTFIPLSPPSSFVSAKSVTDFTGGADEETNTDLVHKLQQGIAAKGFAAVPTNMDALLRKTATYAGIPQTSVVGMGNPEMLRDRHSLVPISYGGRIDWYVRSQENLQHMDLTKTAVLIEKRYGGVGVWQFSVGKDEAPGFYEFRNIRLYGTEPEGGFEIAEDLRGLDLTGGQILPDIQSQAEGAYTAFQTATIRFVDTTTNVTNLDLGATQDYTVEVVGLPLLGDLQDTILSFDYRYRTADVLIKAPIPCFVKLGLTIHQRSTDATPDLAAIKTALAKAVNTVGFTGKLYASKLHDTIHNYLVSGASVGAIDMFGRIRRPDDSAVYLHDTAVLAVTATPELMVTAQTVQFFTDPEDITIEVALDVPLPA